MENRFHVRHATIYDLEGVAKLFDQYRMFYKQESNIEAARAFLFDRFENNQSIIIVAIDQNNSMVGFTQLYPSFSSVSLKRLWILNDLFVTKASRGQGVAQMLLDAAKAYAQATNAKGIVLSTAIDNDSAQRLYERLGYKREDAFFEYFLAL